MNDLKLEQAYIAAPVKNGYPLAPNVEVVPAIELANVLKTI